MRWKLILVLVLGFFAVQWVRQARQATHPPAASGAVTWMTDAPAALARARAENRTILLNFTGSDWCGWCVKLDEEVFSQPEFTQYANKKLVLLKLDFPRHKDLPKSEREQNEGLARQHGVTGFPTILVLKPDGSEKGRLGYRPGGPRAWLESLGAL